MTAIDLNNDELDKSLSMLSALDEAKSSDTIGDNDLMPFHASLAGEFHRIKDCEGNIATADTQIEALQKAIDGWSDYRAYQVRRLPGLKRRYGLARDYIRAGEDEQAGV